MVTKVGNSSAEDIIGTSGSDDLNGMGGNDTIEAGDGLDGLKGGDGNDELYGEGGDDVLYGSDFGAGDDTLDGGSGFDRVYYGGLTTGVSVDMEAGVAKGAGIGSDALYHIEWVIGSEAADWITGRDSDFFGYLGDDKIEGRGGNDVIDGRSGDDDLSGDAGQDNINGGDGDDWIYGGDDRDMLFGDAGDDHLFGSAGDDKMFGGPGADTIDGGSGYNTVSYQDMQEGYDSGIAVYGVELYWKGGNIFGAPEYQDLFIDIQHVIGSRFNDLIQGDRLGVGTSNWIQGGDGEDWLYGDGPDTTASTVGGNDTLDGGNGRDLLRGGAGADVLTGGAGPDTFLFQPFDTGVGAGHRDVITDFQQGSGATGGPGDYIQVFASEDLTFTGGGAFTHADQVRYGYEGNDTLVQVNLDTDTLPEMEILLTGHYSLTASDFYLLNH